MDIDPALTAKYLQKAYKLREQLLFELADKYHTKSSSLDSMAMTLGKGPREETLPAPTPQVQLVDGGIRLRIRIRYFKVPHCRPIGVTLRAKGPILDYVNSVNKRR